MANSLFDIYKEALVGGGNLGGTLVNLASDDIRVVLIDTGTFDPDPAVTENMGQVSGIVGTAVTLTTPPVLDGTFDSDDVTFVGVSGNSIEKLLIYKHTGVPANDIILVQFDTATGLPVTPNSGDIVIQWNLSGIFSL